MQSSVLPADVLYFHCENCGSELSVPISLHGVEGPCPTCGDRIKAPELYIPDSQDAAEAGLALPPADGRHEPPPLNTKGVPAPPWLNRQASAPLPVPAPPPDKGALPIATLRPVFKDGDLLPKHIPVNGNRDFQAKLTIPGFESEADDSWIDRHRAHHQRHLTRKKLDRAANALLESSFFRVARVAMLVITGGLCAGLVLYLKDRQWMLNMPWNEVVEESVAEPPAGFIGEKTPEPAAAAAENPFLVEDSSELERPASAPALTPVPDAVSVPVGAAPMETGKK